MPYKKNVKNTALNELIGELANDLAPTVSAIEQSPMTTKNHYGRYMALLSELGDNPNHKRLIALALIDAGANQQGVKSAMQIHGI